MNVIHESIRGAGADDPHFHIFNSCLRCLRSLFIHIEQPTTNYSTLYVKMK
jgi:hypothetical protein